ncbi:MAG: matrixin family metalloprotease [Rugosibacter sp.]
MALVLLGLLPLAPVLAEPATRMEKPSPGAWPGRVYAWRYNPLHAPAWLDAAAAKAMVLEAAKRWEACGVDMRLLGDTDRAPGAMDGGNVVGWSLAIPPRLRGLTLGRARASRLLERDVAIRPDREEFRRSPQLLQKVITHELGHAIGLTHSLRCDDVMTLAADCPKADPETLPLSPTANDLARCRALYP